MKKKIVSIILAFAFTIGLVSATTGVAHAAYWNKAPWTCNIGGLDPNPYGRYLMLFPNGTTQVQITDQEVIWWIKTTKTLYPGNNSTQGWYNRVQWTWDGTNWTLDLTMRNPYHAVIPSVYYYSNGGGAQVMGVPNSETWRCGSI